MKSELDKVAHHHTDLNVFGTIITILEGGHLYDSDSQTAASRIIAVCRREMERHLTRYDAARASSIRKGEPK
jgi:hypothetical protein